MNTRPPYSYDIVGSFLRKPAIVTARKQFAEGAIDQNQLHQVEDESIRELVADEKRVGLRAVTDGEFRRAFWHLDFLAALKGVEEVKAEHFSVAFQGFQPKSQTLKIVDKVDFPEDHPFLSHFKFLNSISENVTAKQCIPSPSMLHLICCVRTEDYTPIPRYENEIGRAHV